MESPHILIVEDEVAVARILEFFLTHSGYRASCANSGAEALQFLEHTQPDLIILDLQMHPLSGWDVLHWVRSSRLSIPIVVVSAIIGAHEEALDLGSDDFLPKPTQPSIIVAHVKARLREKEMVSKVVLPHTLQFADVVVDTRAYLANRGAHELVLTPREYDLLVFFLRHPTQVCTREVLLESVWGDYFDQGSNVVDVYVRYLRNKLEEGGASRLIQTVRGVGYVLREQKSRE